MKRIKLVSVQHSAWSTINRFWVSDFYCCYYVSTLKIYEHQYRFFALSFVITYSFSHSYCIHTFCILNFVVWRFHHRRFCSCCHMTPSSSSILSYRRLSASHLDKQWNNAMSITAHPSNKDFIFLDVHGQTAFQKLHAPVFNAARK